MGRDFETRSVGGRKNRDRALSEIGQHESIKRCISCDKSSGKPSSSDAPMCMYMSCLKGRNSAFQRSLVDLSQLQEEGFDPEGCVGEITNLYIMSKKYEGEFSTAHRPVVCSFKVGDALDLPCPHMYALRALSNHVSYISCTLYLFLRPSVRRLGKAVEPQLV